MNQEKPEDLLFGPYIDLRTGTVRRTKGPTQQEREESLELVPQELRDRLPSKPSEVSKENSVRLYAPWNEGPYGNWRWYVLRMADKELDIAYCEVEGDAKESGDVALYWIAALRGPDGRRVVRDPNYGVCRDPETPATAVAREEGSAVEGEVDGASWDSWDFMEGAGASDILHCLRSGANPDQLLALAASCNPDPEVITTLCAAGANIHQVDQNYLTLLHKACHGSRPEVVKVLLEQGAEVDCGEYEGRTPLHEAAWRSASPEVIRILVAAGADVDAQTDDYAHTSCNCALGETPLHFAAKQEDSLQVMEALIELGADPDATDSYGNTPLHALTYRETGVKEAAQLLIDAGADLEAANDEGQTPLLMAGLNNYEGSAYEVFRELGADESVVNEFCGPILDYMIKSAEEE